MKEIDNSDLLLWKESIGRFRFQTNDSKISRKMKGRRTFHLTGYSTNRSLWIYYCDLPDVCSAKKRFKGLTGREPKYDSNEEIYY